MPTLLSRRAVLLFKLETANEGIDALPSLSDAVLIEQPLRITFAPNVIDTTEVNPSLDPFDPIVGGMSASIEFDLYLKGNGVAGGTPEWGKLLRACGFDENPMTATTAEPLATGASTIQCTLGPAVIGLNHFYRALPIVFTGAQSFTSFIYSYAASKLAKITDTAAGVLTTSTNYQVLAATRFIPTSSAGILWSATIYIYTDGILYKFVGCRGTCPVTLTSGGPARISFRFMGMFTSKSDASLPAPTYDTTRPPVWKNGAFTIASAPTAGQTLSVDPGNNLVPPDNPNSAESFDPAIITSRQMRGTVNPKESLVAVRNIMNDFRMSIKQPIHARLGTVAGNRIGITIPSALYLNQTPTDQNGYQTVDVPFHATGQDNGYLITVW